MADPQLRSCRSASEADFEPIWQIIHAVVQGGDTYAYPPELTREQAHGIWMEPPVRPYVCVRADQSRDQIIVGTYILKPNQPGLGSHVANGAFMVHPEFRGQGIGRQMGKHALQEARRLGFLAMQFNCVVSTNQAAVALWQQLGFQIVATLPQAFHHRQRGYVDAYIMYQWLDPGSAPA